MKLLMFFVLAILSVNAATISFEGLDDSTGPNWRDSSLSKSLDIDGDDIYGTAGYFLFNIGGGFNPNPLQNSIDETPSFLNLTVNDGNFSVGGFPGLSDINDPLSSPLANYDSGSIGVGFGAVPSQGAEMSIFDINFTAGTPTDDIRIGVLANNSDGENPSQIRFELSGNSSITAFAAITPDNALNSTAEWFFFTLSGFSSGDTFTLFATDALGGGTEIKGIGGVTVDVIPEPSSPILLGLALSGLMIFRSAGRRG